MKDLPIYLGKYITANEYGNFPSGSECEAYRAINGLLLKFGSEEILLPNHYAKDLEPGPDTKCHSFYYHIIAYEDARVFAILKEGISQ